MFRAGTSANNGDCRGFVELQGLAVLSAAPSRTPGMLNSPTSKAASSSSEMAGLPILRKELAPSCKLMLISPKKNGGGGSRGGGEGP